MNKFENEVNNGVFEDKTIEAVIIDLYNDTTFSATINGRTLSEITAKMPEGYEIDRISTLQNYFEPNTIDKWSIELVNSQYVYFSDFQDVLVYDGMYNYIETLEQDNTKKQLQLDASVYQK